MKASVQYNDFIGTAAANISYDYPSVGDKLESFSKYFKIDENRFKIIGISINGTNGFHISFICIDKHKSNAEKEHIVTIAMSNIGEQVALDFLFRNLNLVLYSKHDNKYKNLDYDEELNYEDFHEIKNVD